MKRTVTALLLGVCMISGCKKAESAADLQAAPAAASEAAAASTSDVSGRAAATASAPAAKPPIVTSALLAYAYEYAVETPAGRLPDLLRKHERACTEAGPLVCQVIGADSRKLGKDEASGRLELRATPAWVERFRGGLEADVKAAGGKVASASVGTEDLSRAIVDTEAALRAKRTLRDRLQHLLATHPGKLTDLTELERQVATVQGEIDAAESELAVMRTRVQMQKLTVDYRSLGVLAPDSAWSPLGQAAHGFLRNVVGGFSVIVTVTSYLLPLVLVVGPLVWLGLRRNRRPRAKLPAA